MSKITMNAMRRSLLAGAAGLVLAAGAQARKNHAAPVRVLSRASLTCGT